MKILIVLALAVFFIIITLDFIKGQGSPAANFGAYITLYKERKRQREEAQRRRDQGGRESSCKMKTIMIFTLLFFIIVLIDNCKCQDYIANVGAYITWYKERKKRREKAMKKKQEEAKRLSQQKKQQQKVSNDYYYRNDLESRDCDEIYNGRCYYYK
ncbi:hypothetical protein PVAND_012310 [Polypedilum vanderplanki]|uniref:Uncharacterized protein n=1 Tax=Polypedilum vanderplanki TaxID=319348 RepID=A0A9J6CN08_POLVA|nr:hypothetical protein PVAND_012310 [Polypedilum vanderplanki]